MNKDKQRIAIAEFCGWEYEPKWLPPDDYPYRWAKGSTNSYCGVKFASELPNYPEDLNAMHEAEKVIIAKGLWDRYRSILASVVKHDGSNCDRFIAHATASQRAEALLRTVGKWGEE